MIADLLACDPTAAARRARRRRADLPLPRRPRRLARPPSITCRATSANACRQVRPLADTDPRYAANVAALEAVQPEWLPGRGDLGPPRRRVDPGQRRHPVPRRHPRRQPRRDQRRTRPDHRDVDGHQLRRPLVGRGDRSVGHRPRRRLRPRRRRAEPDPDRRLPHRLRRQRGSSWKPRRWPPTTNAPRWQTAFAEWVWADPDRAGRLEQVYNDRFNSTVLARWDGSHLQHLPGLSAAFVPHRHQLDAVWRHMADRPATCCSATRSAPARPPTMVIAGQELRRTGQITKPLYVVPNHMLDQFAAEFAPAVPDGQGAGRHQATIWPRRPASGSSPAAPRASGTPS